MVGQSDLSIANMVNLVRVILEPKEKVYIREKTILISKNDLKGKEWNLAKLYLSLSETQALEWSIDTYQPGTDEGMWKVILWNPSLRTK